MSSFREIERSLSVLLAGASPFIYYKFGFEQATYIMLVAIMMNIPPDDDVEHKCKEFKNFKSKFNRKETK